MLKKKIIFLCKSAEPLQVHIDVGPWKTEENIYAWGVRAKVETATVYTIYDSLAEDSWVTVNARYTSYLFLPTLPLLNKEGQRTEGSTVLGNSIIGLAVEEDSH